MAGVGQTPGLSFARGLAAALGEMVAYIQDLIVRRRAEPAGDLLTGLIRARTRTATASATPR